VTGLSSAKSSSSPKNAPIGVFDSGVGGLTVLRALRQHLPQEQFVYLGDLARLPYGDKSAETVRRYSVENVEFLNRQGVKMVVVACATATAWSIELLQAHFPLPIIGVIEPAVEAALKLARQGVAILATRGTVTSGVYQARFASHPLEVHAIPCPLFVPLAEEGLSHHEAAHLMARHYLHGLPSTVDALLLGCTHYPLLAQTIAAAVGPQVRLVDPAASCAQAVARLLKEQDLANPSGTGQIRFHFTDRPPHLSRLVETFLGESGQFA
jgi:glutamate racemase